MISGGPISSETSDRSQSCDTITMTRPTSETKSRANEVTVSREDVADAGDVLIDLRGEGAGPRVGEEIDAEIEQLGEDALLVARDDVVADTRQQDRLHVGGDAANEEGGEDRAADQPDQVCTAAIEDLVDHVAHDPCREGRRSGDQQQADDDYRIGPEILPAILRDDPLQQRIGAFRRYQNIPVYSRSTAHPYRAVVKTARPIHDTSRK